MLKRALTLARGNKGILGLVVFTGLAGAFLSLAVILPAWKAPTNRMYPSKLGYPALLRKAGRPLPVTTAFAQERTLHRTALGEGMMMSQPILVPVIPMDRILAVHAEEGQRVTKGDLLIEIDATKAEIKTRSAQIAISTAQAELARVQIGSAYVLAQERPRKDEIDADTARKNIALLTQKIDMTEALAKKGIVSKKELIEAQLSRTASERDLQMAEFDLGMSTKGMPQSQLIATNAVDEAQNALAQRRREMQDYQVFAPCDGIVQQLIVHAGEYNQDAGRPAMVIAAGGWFEANLDQGTVNQVKVGDAAQVHLEALGSQPLSGRVKSIIPIVSYNAGGPEATRPMRPMGTGAPEWPSTFRVRVELDDAAKAAPGMTGFARIQSEHRGLAVPAGAVTSLSAGSGVVHVVDGGRHQAREVRCGLAADGWIEILEGLSTSDKVIADGYQFLLPGDRISETPLP